MQNELDKACFCQNMAHGDFKDWVKSRSSDKVLGDKAFSIAKNPNYDEYQGGLSSIVDVFLLKSLQDVVLHGQDQKPWDKSAIKSRNMPNQQLEAELNKPIIRKFDK